MASSIDLGKLIWGTHAERLAATSVPGGSVWFETDTDQWFGRSPDPTALAWIALAGGGAVVPAWTFFAGAGPHTVTSADYASIVAPGANVTAVVNLPDITTLVDVDQYTFVVGGTALGNATVVLEASGAQTFSNGQLQLGLYEGGEVILRVDTANSRWVIVALKVGTPVNLDLYVATTGSDLNAGSSASPLATIDAAIRRAGQSLWTGYAHINAGAGTFTTASTRIIIPAGYGSGAEPLALLGTAVDSGLGAQPITASSAGSGSAFGTVTNGAAAYGVNTYRDYWVRITASGTPADIGKKFLIASHTNTVITVAGTFVAGATEFVIEQPDTILRYVTEGVTRVLSLYGAPLVAQQVRFDAQGAGGFIFLRNILYFSACQFLTHSSINPMEGGQLMTQNSSATFNPAPSTLPLATIGASFTGSAATSLINTQGGPSLVGVRNSNIRMRSLASGLSIMTYVSCMFASNGAITAQFGAALQIISCVFDTVTAINGQYAVSCIVINNANGTVSDAVVNNCTGIVIEIGNQSTCSFTSVTGAGNAGVPVQIRRRSGLLNSVGNAVTGAVIGNDVQVGGNGGPTPWAAVNAGLVTDMASGAEEFCTAANN